ncbi:AAA family ATPase [Mycobacterium sp. ZZG]
MTLTEREHELDQLAARGAAARTGRGGAVLVCGESGAGKTSFVEAFVADLPADTRVLWGACGPLSTPRPLGPLRDVASGFTAATRKHLANGDQPYDIFVAVFEDLHAHPSVLVLDDLQWADQGTIDLLRFLLRRAAQSHLLMVGILRDDEVSVTHPLRGLLGDVARSPHGLSLTLPALSPAAIAAMVGDRDVDPDRLHQITGGNAFFVCEMLDHDGVELPVTVRDPGPHREPRHRGMGSAAPADVRARRDRRPPADRARRDVAGAARPRPGEVDQARRPGGRLPPRPVPAGDRRGHAAGRRARSAPPFPRRTA